MDHMTGTVEPVQAAVRQQRVQPLGLGVGHQSIAVARDDRDR